MLVWDIIDMTNLKVEWICNKILNNVSSRIKFNYAHIIDNIINNYGPIFIEHVVSRYNNIYCKRYDDILMHILNAWPEHLNIIVSNYMKMTCITPNIITWFHKYFPDLITSDFINMLYAHTNIDALATVDLLFDTSIYLQKIYDEIPRKSIIYNRLLELMNKSDKYIMNDDKTESTDNGCITIEENGRITIEEAGTYILTFN
jgi:hypothetical protein